MFPRLLGEALNSLLIARKQENAISFCFIAYWWGVVVFFKRYMGVKGKNAHRVALKYNFFIVLFT